MADGAGLGPVGKMEGAGREGGILLCTWPDMLLWQERTVSLSRPVDLLWTVLSSLGVAVGSPAKLDEEL